MRCNHERKKPPKNGVKRNPIIIRRAEDLLENQVLHLIVHLTCPAECCPFFTSFNHKLPIAL